MKRFVLLLSLALLALTAHFLVTCSTPLETDEDPGPDTLGSVDTVFVIDTQTIIDTVTEIDTLFISDSTIS